MANLRREGCVKKRRKLQLSDEQQLIVGVLLVVLLAISILYCLGFASIAVRHTWDNAPLPWKDTSTPEGTTSVPSPVIVEPTDAGAAPH
jgi:hypothetical protein